MMPAAGDLLALDVERPAHGGRMIARHDGAVVLVAGAIPGERVRARVERVQRGTCFARVVDVVTPSPDRVTPPPGLACGGQVFAHITDARQRALKTEILADTFRRQARLTLDAVAMTAGPPDGYRTRARAHVDGGRWGFFEAGSHTPCDVTGSRQLAEAGAAALDRLCGAVAAAAPGGRAEVEWVEAIPGAPRVAHVHLTAGAWARPVAPVDGVDGCAVSDGRHPMRMCWGTPFVVDVVEGVAGPVHVRHHVRAFFQGNRYLLQGLVDEVVRRVPAETVADLYAGVGLFSAALACAGRRIDAVEGDDWSAADLHDTAARVAGVRAVHESVERFLARGGARRYGAVVVDPPRTGLGAGVAATLAGAGVPTVVYVSCDPVTLARDVRVFVEAGYALTDVRGFDLFPRTAHVETVVTLTAGR